MREFPLSDFSPANLSGYTNTAFTVGSAIAQTSKTFDIRGEQDGNELRLETGSQVEVELDDGDLRITHADGAEVYINRPEGMTYNVGGEEMDFEQFTNTYAGVGMFEVEDQAPVHDEPEAGDTVIMDGTSSHYMGTEGNDEFTNADYPVARNDLGYVVNTFGTGDFVDGNGGDENSIYAKLIPEAFGPGAEDAMALNPRTENIQKVEFDVLDILDDQGEVTVDATHMNGVNHYASANSRNDLEIVNVNIEDTQITEDITLEMRSTQPNNTGEPYGSDMSVYFNETSLREAAPEVEADAEFFVQLADADQDDPNAPLANVRITDLNINHDGNEIQLGAIESTDDTYAGLAEAINNALEEAGYGDRYEARVDADQTYDEVNDVDIPVEGQNVVVEDISDDPVEFAEGDIQLGVGNKLGVGGSATVLGDSGVDFAEQRQEFSVVSSVILDDVGRGSNGGDLTVGSMSDSNTSTGVEIIDIDVKQTSSLGDIASTNGTLRELHISNYYDTDEGERYDGSLFLRNENSSDDDTINGGERILVEDFEGNLVLGMDGAIKDDELVLADDQANAEAIENLGYLDAGSISGNVYFNAENNSGDHHVIETGSGDDVIDLTQDGDQGIPDDATTSEITIAGGDNRVSVEVDTASAEPNDDESEITINGGGDNWVAGDNAAVTVTTGSGDDVIYASTDGTTDGNASLETIANTNTPLRDTSDELETEDIEGSDVALEHLLWGRTVEVTLAAPGDTADSGEVGFESKEVRIEPEDRYLTSERDLWEAVADAINEDPVLQELATASVDDDGELSIDYKVNGEGSDNGVEINLSGEWDDLSNAEKDGILDALQNEYNNSAIEDVETEYNGVSFDGSDNLDFSGGSDGDSDESNTVNAGSGDNVIVLNSDGTNSDTVEFNVDDIGHNTIVNFEAGSDNDVLDFTAWLDNVASESSSTESRERIDTTLAANIQSFEANSVVEAEMSDFEISDIFDFGDADDDDDWSSLADTGRLLEAMNENDDFSSDDQSTGDLVGDEQNSIMLVEFNHGDIEDDNRGMYKVFQVTSDATSGDGDSFVSVQLVGTVDFGEEQSFDESNFA
ncbi:hypothetical protein LRD18_12575 [Halorhodospira halochloris]|uniref:hypothetical protein n=1 Tax=Halorhodospira halochloris TaxID=1052 RepID=UPI001EE95D32|nr:hypothetical protein [Halorhodospira halochloris]MCG5531671.1 hypothetical protein [Halorhodospira halochloris]